MIPKIELFMFTAQAHCNDMVSCIFYAIAVCDYYFSMQFVVKQHRLPLMLCATQTVSYRNKDRLLLSGLHN